MTEAPSLLLAFGAGLLSFLSPCVLPLYPSYLSYIGGIAAQGAGPLDQRRVLLHALLFVLGFSLVFVALGASASALGSLWLAHRETVQKVGGLFILLLAAHLVGWLPLPFLERERRFAAVSPGGALGAFVVGLTFGAGWTPCIGPILMAILVMAGTGQAPGYLLLGAYAAGLAVPFLALARAAEAVRRLAGRGRIVKGVSGALLALMGVLLYTDGLRRMTAVLVEWTGFQGL